MHPPLAVWLCATHFPSLSLRFWSLGSLERTLRGNRCCSSLCEERGVSPLENFKGVCVQGVGGSSANSLCFQSYLPPPPNLSSSQGPVSHKPLIFFQSVTFSHVLEFHYLTNPLHQIPWQTRLPPGPTSALPQGYPDLLGPSREDS